MGRTSRIFTPNFNLDTIARMTDGGDHIGLSGFGAINFQSLLITPDPTFVGSDIRVIGDVYSSGVLHVLDMAPSDFSPGTFLYCT